MYGNATYIIPKIGWEEMSKMSKSEVLNSKEIITKINHTSSWSGEFSKIMRKYN